MSHVIEGVVKELKKVSENDESIKFKLYGSEGFSIKVENRKFNVCAEEKLLENDTDGKESIPAFIISQEHMFSAKNVCSELIIQAALNGKRIRISFENQSQNLTEPTEISSAIVIL